MSFLVSGNSRQKAQHEIAEFFKKFVPTYILAYKSALIAKVEADQNKSKSSGAKRELLSRPDPTENVWAGWATKEGGFIHNWKRRWFVMRANYEVDYYVAIPDEGAPAKKKGVINVSGYRVHENTSKGKPNCIELHHPNRRCYFIYAENEEEKAEMVEAFKLACRKCKPPENPDKVAGKAFSKAYEKTRLYYRYYDSWRMEGTESEMLGKLVARILDDTVMEDIYRGMPLSGSPFKGIVKKAANKTINAVTISAVGAGWKKAAEEVTNLRPKLEKPLADAIGPVYKAKNDLKEKFKEKVTSAMEPVISSMVRPVVGKVFEVMMYPVINAYEKLINSFMEMANEHAPKMADPSNFGTELHYMEHETSKTWSKYNKPATSIIKVVEAALAFIHEFVKDIHPHELVDPVMDALVKIMGDAVYTLSHCLLEDKMEYGAAVDKVRKEFIHDSKLDIISIFLNLMLTLIMTNFKKEVVPLIEEPLKPLEDAIPGPVKEFLDLDTVVEEFLDETMIALIKSAVNPPCKEELEKFDGRFAAYELA
eukprot:CAMPEP_0113903322 /NCGR_PEP_ID=MMETSP0780_2-20120614/22449_1 /TAXON_ID=652834 /ORGANISM="Palpitomonas bilix" /LENGTH=536 /DNA_ID=CAMNT_0000896441 /DNA_START=8 /DNA_END=1618 /DNA_ORIENTATION=+ /assembly_acc=CAM_ASM_000599